MENRILFDKHVCLYLSETDDVIKRAFCGRVYTDMNTFNATHLEHDAIIYLVGDIKYIYDNINPEHKTHHVCVVKELSCNTECWSEAIIISPGQVPLSVHGQGILFRKLFNEENIFDRIKTEHDFQQLTQSNKGGTAFRKGIYLTNVERKDDATYFNLLRCSTNLDGPTGNFRETDHMVIGTVNNLANAFFAETTELNHVLAQIYDNTVEINGPKTVEKKATIKAHSDKTKDMPQNAIMAFCTFYNTIVNKTTFPHLHVSSTDPFDYCKGRADTSAFCKLLFKLKADVTETTDSKSEESYVPEFSVTLYPNSVFLIPLSTNRLYTHEVCASTLHVSDIPTRMGYVIRCSNTKAMFKDGKTYIMVDGTPTEMKPITDEDRTDLRNKYYAENVYSKHVDYGTILYSMNEGDYKEPIC